MFELPRMGRGTFLIGSAAAGAFVAARGVTALADDAAAFPFGESMRSLVAYPQKRPLIVLALHPVRLETPLSVFNDGILTPNDAFFVRWHGAGVPTAIDISEYWIRVHGYVNSALELRVDDLRTEFEAVEVAAVCECAGNPAGGAMGNARWRGARLRDVLAKAGVAPGALSVRCSGAQTAIACRARDYARTLDIDQALDPDVIVAYAMNGADLPVLNGYPLRLVIPGYAGAHWVKMISDIEVMGGGASPKTAMESISPDVPDRLAVRSLITSVFSGTRVQAGKQLTVRGIAFDGGSGIKQVLFSSDGGEHWLQAKLGQDYGRYSFRSWEARFAPSAGLHALVARASNGAGQVQRSGDEAHPASDYLRNAADTIRIQAV